jgi:SMI1 / KNR4 family (SUKH-1)
MESNVISFGATSELLDKVELAFSVLIPNDLRIFWQESNGRNLWFGYKELQFFSIQEILGDDIYYLKTYMPNAIPICLDGNGNICVARVEASSINGYFVASCGNLDWSSAVEIASNFTDFLQDSSSPDAKLNA